MYLNSADLLVYRWFLIQSVNLPLNIGLFRYKVVDNDRHQVDANLKNY